MNVLCAICQDLMVPSNDIFLTPCGHVFHFPCLVRWLEKSYSCPECRQKVMRDKITRIYFNFTTTEDIREDSVTLQQKVDSLVFQVKLKNEENKNWKSDNVALKKQVIGIRDELRKIENDLAEKKAVIRAMKEESSYFQEKYKDYDRIKDEKNKLEKELSKYNCVKALLCESEQYVARMLEAHKDVPTLVTYVSVMKKELSESLSKRKKLRDTIRKLEQEVQSLKMEKSSCASNYLKQIEELQELLAVCKSEYDELKKKYDKLKGGSNEADNTLEEALDVSIENAVSRKRGTEDNLNLSLSPAKRLKESLSHLQSITSVDSDGSDIVFLSPVPIRKSKENAENSPYLPTKSRSFLNVKDQDSQHSGLARKTAVWSSKNLASNFKAPRQQDRAIAFDGFGGHSKLDSFPISKKSPSKLKRSVNDSSKNKKIKLDLVNNKHLDDFVINLT